MNKKIKICHLTSAHKSGDIRIFQKECTFLAKEKSFEVYLVAQGDSREENGVKVIGVDASVKGRVDRMLNISRKIYKKASSLNADIYHFHDPELLLYALKLKKQGAAVIFDSHEHYAKQIAEKNYLPVLLRKVIANIYKIYETHVVKNIDAVVVPGTTNGKNPFEGRCRNSIFLDNYPILDERRAYIQKRKPDSIHDLKVCYVGGLSATRGCTQLVKGCYKAGVKLILAGSFSSPEYEKQVMSMKEGQCVDYRGVCSYDEVTEIYRESHIGAATLLKIGQYASMENLPTKTYEYMQVGLPIIMSDTKYNCKLMERGKFAYLVDPGNEDEIKKVIQYVYYNFNEAVEKTKLAYKLVKDKYNWEGEFKNLIALYRKLTNV